MKCNYPIFSSPCLIKHDNDQLLIVLSSFNLLICTKLNSDVPEWTFVAESNIYANVILLKQWNILLIIETNGQLHLLNIFTGLPIDVEYSLPGQVFSTPIFHQNRLFVGCRDSFIHCLKIEN